MIAQLSRRKSHSRDRGCLDGVPVGSLGFSLHMLDVSSEPEFIWLVRVSKSFGYAVLLSLTCCLLSSVLLAALV